MFFIENRLRSFPWWLIGVVMMGFVGATASAQSWFDNFDDGNYDDGDPVTWSINPQGQLPGQYDATSGDFVMIAPDGNKDDESMAAWVDSATFTNGASVRTRASLIQDPSGVITGFGNVGVALFFDPMTVSGYIGLFSVDQNLQLTIVTNGVADGLMSMDMPFAPDDDVYIQLDHDGEDVSLTTWQVGTLKPSPQISLPHDVYTSGKSGIVFNENAPNDAGIFRWARAASQPIVDGDVDLDGNVDADDIDTLYENLGSADPLFDLNEDGLADSLDVDRLVLTYLNTNYGDANLDGFLSRSDFDAWHANLFQDNTGWATGDFNGDRSTDVSDFNIWNDNKPAATAVPEPSSLLLLACASAVWILRQRSEDVAECR